MARFQSEGRALLSDALLEYDKLKANWLEKTSIILFAEIPEDFRSTASAFVLPDGRRGIRISISAIRAHQQAGDLPFFMLNSLGHEGTHNRNADAVANGHMKQGRTSEADAMPCRVPISPELLGMPLGTVNQQRWFADRMRDNPKLATKQMLPKDIDKIGRPYLAALRRLAQKGIDAGSLRYETSEKVKGGLRIEFSDPKGVIYRVTVSINGKKISDEPHPEKPMDWTFFKGKSPTPENLAKLKQMILDFISKEAGKDLGSISVEFHSEPVEEKTGSISPMFTASMKNSEERHETHAVMVNTAFWFGAEYQDAWENGEMEVTLGHELHHIVLGERLPHLNDGIITHPTGIRRPQS